MYKTSLLAVSLLVVLSVPAYAEQGVIQLPAAIVSASAAQEAVGAAAANQCEIGVGAAAKASHCEVDSDGDGVPDAHDKCPVTPVGAKIDEQGCQKVVLKDIHQILYVQFVVDQAIVQEVSYPDIEAIAKLAEQYPGSQIELVGYTDTSGIAERNLQLSKDRAEAVRVLLVDRFGVEAGRVTADGRGDAKPIADNATEEGRSKNRRVEVTLKAVTKIIS